MVLVFIRSIACMLFFSDVYDEMIEISSRKSRKWSKVTRLSMRGTPKTSTRPCGRVKRLAASATSAEAPEASATLS